MKNLFKGICIRMSKKSLRKIRAWTITFLYYYGKVMGMFPLTLNHEQEFKRSYKSIIYAIVISMLYILLFYCTLLIDYNADAVNQEIFVAFIVEGFINILQVSAIVLSWLIFAFRQKKIQTIIKNIQKNGEIGRKLGLPDDNAEIVQTVAIRAIFVNVYFTVALLIEQVCTAKLILNTTLLFIPYKVGQIVIWNVFFLFITALQIMQRRFFRLNVALRKLLLNNFREDTLCEENSDLR